MRKFIFIIIIFLISFFTTIQNAKEILIYADSIEYDNEKNVIAKGNAKIISYNQNIHFDFALLHMHN